MPATAACEVLHAANLFLCQLCQGANESINTVLVGMRISLVVTSAALCDSNMYSEAICSHGTVYVADIADFVHSLTLGILVYRVCK